MSRLIVTLPQAENSNSAYFICTDLHRYYVTTLSENNPYKLNTEKAFPMFVGTDYQIFIFMPDIPKNKCYYREWHEIAPDNIPSSIQEYLLFV